jgi:hypothetical protein
MVETNEGTGWKVVYKCSSSKRQQRIGRTDINMEEDEENGVEDVVNGIMA